MPGTTWYNCKTLVMKQKQGYGACRSAALSAFLKVDNRHSFFIVMRDAIVQLCCCVFLQSFPNWSHKPTLGATIAILGNVSSRQLLFHVHLISLKTESLGYMISYDPMFGQSFGFIWDSFCELSCKLLGEDVTTYQERLENYWTKMLQRIRNVLQVTGRRCYNLSGTPCQLLGEDVKTYQERLASYWTKMLQRIRNVLQVTGRRCYRVSGTSCKLLDEDVTTYQERLASYLRCYNVSGTSCKLPGEDVTTYQERLANYWTKMLQRIRNHLPVTGRRCYNVSGTSCKLLDEDVTTYQERLASYWTKMLQRIRKSLLTMQTTGRYYTPPKPFPKRTMCKSDSSPAPRGAPSPKTARPRSSAA